MEMKDQKSIIVDVQMPRGEKMFALQFDKKLRECTDPCRKSALHQGLTKGDEVYYTVDYKDRFSYLKKTGEHFDLKELPKPTGAIIDAEKAQQQAQKQQEQPAPPPVKTDWERKFELEQRKSEIIMWEALLNTATEIVLFGGDEKGERIVDGIVMEETTEQAVKRVAENLYAFIMEKVGEGK